MKLARVRTNSILNCWEMSLIILYKLVLKKQKNERPLIHLRFIEILVERRLLITNYDEIRLNGKLHVILKILKEDAKQQFALVWILTHAKKKVQKLISKNHIFKDVNTHKSLKRDIFAS